MIALLRKELLELFATPAAYASTAVFWTLAGFLFSFNVFYVRADTMVSAFHNLSLLLLLLTPILTMRSVAEEASGGTLELLFSYALREHQIVLAKFLALQVLLAVMLLGTAAAVAPLVWYGDPDPGPIWGGYLGLWLYGSALFALGLFVSSLCRSQVVAAVLCWGVLLALWFAHYGADLVEAPAATRSLRHVSFSQHTRSVIRGVLDSGSAVYFLSVALVATVWATQVLRWRRG